MKTIKIDKTIKVYINSNTLLKVKVISGDIEVQIYKNALGDPQRQTMNPMQGEMPFEVKDCLMYKIIPIPTAEIEYILINVR